MSPAGHRLGAVVGAALSALLCAAPGGAQPTPRVPGDMRAIRAGTYVPFYRLAAQPTVTVRAFLLDARPVTNAAFLDFVRAQAAWQRARTRRLPSRRGSAVRGKVGGARQRPNSTQSAPSSTG